MKIFHSWNWSQCRRHTHSKTILISISLLLGSSALGFVEFHSKMVAAWNACNHRMEWYRNFRRSGFIKSKENCSFSQVLGIIFGVILETKLETKARTTLTNLAVVVINLHSRCAIFQQNRNRINNCNEFPTREMNYWRSIIWFMNKRSRFSVPW